MSGFLEWSTPLSIMSKSFLVFVLTIDVWHITRRLTVVILTLGFGICAFLNYVRYWSHKVQILLKGNLTGTDSIKLEELTLTSWDNLQKRIWKSVCLWHYWSRAQEQIIVHFDLTCSIVVTLMVVSYTIRLLCFYFLSNNILFHFHINSDTQSLWELLQYSYVLQLLLCYIILQNAK